MSIKTVFIWPNTGKENMVSAVVRLCELMERCSMQVILPHESLVLGLPQDNIQYISPEEGVRLCDIVLSLGGDGTILHIAELAAHASKPMIGVNLGHIGFITELEYSEIEQIEHVFSGNYTLDCRMMLDLSVEREGTCIHRQTALNDIILTKSNPFRVIHVDIQAGGVPATSFLGDGVVIATPTGSTGYSLSAGGAILEPAAENIVITPICAHNFYAKPMVFSPEREIIIAATGPDGSGVGISADGRSCINLLPSDRVVIRKSNVKTQLIRVKGNRFFQILQQKFSGRE